METLRTCLLDLAISNSIVHKQRGRPDAAFNRQNLQKRPLPEPCHRRNIRSASREWNFDVTSQRPRDWNHMDSQTELVQVSAQCHLNLHSIRFYDICLLSECFRFSENQSEWQTELNLKIQVSLHLKTPIVFFKILFLRRNSLKLHFHFPTNRQSTFPLQIKKASRTPSPGDPPSSSSRRLDSSTSCASRGEATLPCSLGKKRSRGRNGGGGSLVVGATQASRETALHPSYPLVTGREPRAAKFRHTATRRRKLIPGPAPAPGLNSAQPRLRNFPRLAPIYPATWLSSSSFTPADCTFPARASQQSLADRRAILPFFPLSYLGLPSLPRAHEPLRRIERRGFLGRDSNRMPPGGAEHGPRRRDVSRSGGGFVGRERGIRDVREREIAGSKIASREEKESFDNVRDEFWLLRLFNDSRGNYSTVKSDDEWLIWMQLNTLLE